MFNKTIHAELLECGFKYTELVDFQYPYSHDYNGFKYSYDDKIVITKYDNSDFVAYRYLGVELAGFVIGSAFQEALYNHIYIDLQKIGKLAKEKSKMAINTSFTTLSTWNIGDQTFMDNGELPDIDDDEQLKVDMNNDWEKLDDFHWQHIIKFNILKIEYNAGSKDFTLFLNDSPVHTNKLFNSVISYFNKKFK